MKRTLTAADILPLEEYERVRGDKRREILAAKKNRRVAVGPYATFYFESYDTMWMQVQEMLRIEKGGAAQMKDELEAYAPMVPKGNELVATVMFEIEDPAKRQEVLSSLGGIEHRLQLRFDGETITGEPERDLEYTSPEGKASSVQFAHFRFSPSQLSKFRMPSAEVLVVISHPRYSHMAGMPQVVKEEVLKDFA
jgi:Protein of unknown function (DUF3501)